MQQILPQLNPFIETVSYITRAYELCSREPCEKFGLSQTELDIIAFLANNRGTDTAGDVVTYRCISKASVSLTVDSLVKKHLLTETPDPHDRRRVHLTLTPEAEKMVPVINASRDTLRDILFAGFSSTQKDMLLAGIAHAADNAHEFISRKNTEAKK